MSNLRKREHEKLRPLVAKLIWALLMVSAILFAFIVLIRPRLCIHITVVYSGEVDYYLPAIIDDFNARSLQWGVNPDTNALLGIGIKPICVSGYQVRAGTVRNEIIKSPHEQNMPPPSAMPGVQDTEPPTVWIPSVSTWLLLTNHDARRPLFDLSEAKATALAPVVIAIWQSRLDAIRNKVGYHDIGWEELLQVLTSPNGWCDYGLSPCRHAVFYGHTNPFNSPTGLSTLIAEFYASARANGFSAPTLDRSIINRPDVRDGVREIERAIRHYSDRQAQAQWAPVALDPVDQVGQAAEAGDLADPADAGDAAQGFSGRFELIGHG
jgi:hypothetical protein